MTQKHETEFDVSAFEAILNDELQQLNAKPVSPAADKLSQQERQAFSNSESVEDIRQNYQADRLQEEIADTQSARQLREGYAKKTFWMVCCCLFFWGAVISYMMYWNVKHGLPPVSEKVFITLTAGITANIFAAFLGVIRGIFRLSAEESRKSE